MSHTSLCPHPPIATVTWSQSVIGHFDRRPLMSRAVWCDRAQGSSATTGGGTLTRLWYRVGVLTAAGALAAAQMAFFAAPAHAATGVSLQTGLNRLVVTAASGRANNITVALSGGNIVISDTGDTVAVGAGCTAGP